MGRRSKRNKPNVTGRNNTSRFARLDHGLLKSNAYRALSPNARSLLVELVTLYNGENNGSLYLGVRDGAHRMGVADLTAASRAFDELQELGFIEMTVDSKFRSGSSGQSRARCWRLTWEAGPGRKGPSMDFMNREPDPKTQARKRMDRGLRALKAYRQRRGQGKFPVLDSETLGACQPKTSPESVLESNTLNRRNGGFQPNRIVRDSATHLATPWGERTTSSLIGWWQPDWTPSIRTWAIAALASEALLDEMQKREAA